MEMTTVSDLSAWQWSVEARRRGCRLLLLPDGRWKPDPVEPLKPDLLPLAFALKDEIRQILEDERYLFRDPVGILYACTALGIMLDVEDGSLTVEPDEKVYTELQDAIERHLEGLIEMLSNNGPGWTLEQTEGWRERAIRELRETHEADPP